MKLITFSVMASWLLLADLAQSMEISAGQDQGKQELPSLADNRGLRRGKPNPSSVQVSNNVPPMINVLEDPSEIPSTIPSETPSTVPSETPSTVPSEIPSTIPSEMPSQEPSGALSEEPPPTINVIGDPIEAPVSPSATPSPEPSGVLSEEPRVSLAPSTSEPSLSQRPSSVPVSNNVPPTINIIEDPTEAPVSPSATPSQEPSGALSEEPSVSLAPSTSEPSLSQRPSSNRGGKKGGLTAKSSSGKKRKTYAPVESKKGGGKKGGGKKGTSKSS